MAVQFLEVNPEFFRAGYIKEKTVQLLKRVDLTQEQRARLRRVVLDRIQGRIDANFDATVAWRRIYRTINCGPT